MHYICMYCMFLQDAIFGYPFRSIKCCKQLLILQCCGCGPKYYFAFPPSLLSNHGGLPYPPIVLGRPGPDAKLPPQGRRQYPGLELLQRAPQVVPLPRLPAPVAELVRDAVLAERLEVLVQLEGSEESKK